MRVLLVTNMFPNEKSPYYGIFVKEQIEAVKRFHDDVKYEVFYIDGASSQWNYLKTIPELIMKVESGMFDLVHIHYGFSGLFLLAMHKIDIPVVVTLHGGDIQTEQGKTVQVWFTKRILRKAVYAITLNDVMDSVVKHYCKQMVQCPCSVNTDVFYDKQQMRDAHDIKKIVFPSDRERWVKNFPLFEEVLAVLKTHYDIETTFAEVKNMNRDEICQLFNDADLLIMTSRSEGSPQVIKEAMACNLPVVTTPVGDVRHLLDCVENCVVCDTHNASEIAAGAAKILAKGNVRSTGRKQILKHGLDDKSIASKIYDVYKSVI